MIGESVPSLPTAALVSHSHSIRVCGTSVLQQCWYGGWLLGPEALLGHPQLDGLAAVRGEVLLRRLDQVADEELGVRPQVSLASLGHHGHQLHHCSLESQLVHRSSLHEDCHCKLQLSD